ncbi:MAG: multiheme c-type cytochrome, partial [Planctomycetaceae bacterium]
CRIGWLLAAGMGVMIVGMPPGSVRAADSPVVVPRYVGVNSCAAANCHGGDGTGHRWTSSYSVWIQRDTHARAFSTLHGKASRAIVQALGWKQPAHQAVACLNCHALPAPADGGTGHLPQLASDGVSCEACHGPAGRWLPLHVRKGWAETRRRTTDQELWSRLGFVNTENIQFRARVCAGCHVGGPGRDVNHDLIAAGHPRLNFELSNFHANLPGHWDDMADRKRHAGQVSKPEGTLRELKLWAVGQVETLRARAVLSRWRAGTKSVPWPELSETRCFSCHHDLGDARWRREVARSTGRRPGQFPWAGWERPAVGTLQILKPVAAGDKLLSVLDRVDKITRPVAPDREALQQQTIILVRQLEEWSNRLAGHRFSVKDLDALARRLVAVSKKPFGLTDWDQAAQLYLALSSIQVAQREATNLDDGRRRAVDRALRDALPVMRTVLQFPDGHDSAGQFRGPVRDGGLPGGLKRFQTETKKIRATLVDNGGKE